MCPSTHSIRSSVLGRKRSISEPVVQECSRELLARIDHLASNKSYSIAGNESFAASCRLPLSASQSRLLADLVTILVPHSTWWSTQERKDEWVLLGMLGEDSGPQVTVCITATSDRDVMA